MWTWEKIIWNWLSHLQNANLIGNSFAPNSFKERTFFKKIFAVVSPLRLCKCAQVCVKKFLSLSWKWKSGKLENPNSLPDLKKKYEKICQKRFKFWKKG